jgi:hypothetical protein
MTDDNGFFNLTLAAGSYWFFIEDSKPRKVVVSDQAAAQLLQDLLGGGPGSLSVGSNYTLLGNQFQLLSTSGTWFGFCAKGAYPTLSVGILQAGTQSNFRHRNGMYESFNPDDSNFYAPFITGALNAPSIAFAPLGQAPFVNDRYSAGRWQLCNPVLQRFYTVFFTGSDLGPAIGFGAPEL